MKVTELIFKSTQTIDEDTKELTERLTWAFKETGNGRIGNTKKAENALIDHDFDQSLKQSRLEFDAFNQAVERNMASGMAYADAMTAARTQVDFTSQSLREHCDGLAEVYKAEGDLTKRQTQVNASWDEFSEKQKKAQAETKKTQKGFSALSASTKAMLSNIGLELAVAFAMQAAMKGWELADEAWGLTAQTRIEHMETAVNDYNDALSSSSENISTIKSLSDEFSRLAEGVDSSGRNIGLNAEEYDRYNEIVSQLVEMNPELVQGYTSEGNAIVNRNSAIEDGIALQEEYAEKAQQTYVKNGDDIIDGTKDNVKSARKDLRKSLNAGSTYTRGVGQRSYSSDLNKLYYDQPDIDLANATLSEMKELDNMRYQYLKKLELSNEYTDEEKESIKESSEAFHQGLLDMESAYQPVYEWLSAAMATASSDGSAAIADTIPESLRAAYETGLKYISMQDLDDYEMKSAGKSLASDLQDFYSGATEEGAKYAEIQDKITEAQEKLKESLDGIDDDSDIKTYEDTIEDYLDTIDVLADELEAQGGTVNEALANIIRSEGIDALNLAEESVLDLAEAFNPLQDEIEEARNAKETFDAALEGGDYHTAVNAYKEIYDEVIDGFDNAGNGTMAFWQAAEQMLGADTLKEYGYDIDKVNAKMKSLSGVLGDTEASTDNFYRMLANNQELIDEGFVTIKDNGAISFDIDDSDLDTVADKLNISKELLAALIDSARHWSDIDLSNTGEVEAAIRSMESTFSNSDTGTSWNFLDAIDAEAAAAGVNVAELNRKIEDLEGVEIIDLSLFDKEDKIADVTQQLIDMNSALGSKDAEGNFSMNADAIIAQLTKMGRSATEITDIIENLNEQGWIDSESYNSEDFTSWSDYVNEATSALNESEPFQQMANSLDAIVQGVNDIVLALGGIPTDIEFKSNANEIEDEITNLQTNGEYSEADKATIEKEIDAQLAYYEKIKQNAKASGDKEAAKQANAAIKRYTELANVLDEMPDSKSIEVTITKKEAHEGDALSNELEKAESYFNKGELGEKAYSAIVNGTLESKFGNVDMDKRVIIEWSDELKKTYEDELASWDYNPEVGAIDTVFGGSMGFLIGDETVEVAYTPIMNVDDEAVMLGKETVMSYIQQIMDIASADGKWDLAEILELDKQGLQVGDQFVSGLIATVGDEGNYSAIETGILMHFAGENGAIGLALEDIKVAADEAGLSMQEWINMYNALFPDNKIELGVDADEFYRLFGDYEPNVDTSSLEFSDGYNQDKEQTITTQIDAKGSREWEEALSVLSDDQKDLMVNASIGESVNYKDFINAISMLEDGDIKAQIIVDAINSGALDSLFDELDDTDKEVVVKAITEGTDDVEGLNEILQGLDPLTALTVTALVEGANNNLCLVRENANNLDGATANVYTVADTSGTQSDLANVMSQVSWLDGKSATITVKAATGTALEKIKEVAGKAAAIASGNDATGTSGRRGQSHFPSMAKGGIRGNLGPSGHGGLTLTGELGTELVWIPSEGKSYLVGMYGPEMVNLPSDAVVYPADETRRIVGDAVPKNRMRFGSMASGDKIVGSSDSGGSSSSSKSSSSKSKKITIDNYEKELAALEHQLEMGYITEVTYYKKLKALYKKYSKALKKSTEDNRKALEAQRQARIDAYESEVDALDHKLKMGEISEAQYYKKLKALGDKYYKGVKGFTDEWNAHLEARKDAQSDAYDAELEKLDKQLEKELISIEKYFTEVEKLQTKYLSGSEMADVLEDANEDKWDTLRDTLDDMFDDVQQQIDDNDLFNLWVEGGEDAVDMLKGFRKQIEKDGRKYFESEKDWREYLLELDREIAEAEQEAFENKQDNLETILDLVEATIRQESDDYIDALNKVNDSYQDIISAKKKSLQLTEDELAFEEEMEDYASQISKLRVEIANLSLDDSRSAAAKRAEKEEELADLLKEQQKTQREETLNRTEDSLDDQADLFSQLIDKQIELVENWQSNQAAVLETVQGEIANRETNDLLNRIIAYNGEHGDAMLSTVNEAWGDLQSLIGEYGDDVESIVETLQKGINVKVVGGIISTDQTDYAETQAETRNQVISTHHTGLATGFVGNGADLKQHEVLRLLTDDELVFNREDQMRIAGQLQVLDTIQSSFANLKAGVVSQPTQNNQSVELVINAPITIEGTASSETVDEIKQAISDTATASLDKLTEALRINGVHTRAAANVRKN